MEGALQDRVDLLCVDPVIRVVVFPFPDRLCILLLFGFFQEASLHVHVVRHFIPWDNKACPVGTENGTGRVGKVPLRIICHLYDDLLRVMARVVTGKI